MKYYNFNGLAGCVKQSRPRRGKARPLVGLYYNEQADLDTAGGPWSLVCEDHGTCMAMETQSLARDMMSCPEEWCEDCGRDT